MDGLEGIVLAVADGFEIHESFQSDHPAPLFLDGLEAEIAAVLGVDLDGGSGDIVLLEHVAAVLPEFGQLHRVVEYLPGVVLEDQQVRISQNHPLLLPVLQEFTALVPHPFPDHSRLQLLLPH